MITLALDIITTAAILFIVAAGLLIVFGVMKIINFAHGVVHHRRSLCRAGHFPARAAAGAGARAGVPRRRPVGAAAERVVVRPLYDRPLDAILATWGLGIVDRSVGDARLRARSAVRAGSDLGHRYDLWARTIRAIVY